MKAGRLGMLAGFCMMAMLCASCQTWLGKECMQGCGADGCAEIPGRHAKVCEEPTMMSMAHDLDWMQCRIDEYGSVTAKVPDVWGQARLTKYREEFERQMAPEVSKFIFSFQGQQAISDQAAFTQALALSAAISGRNAVQTTPTKETLHTKEEVKELKPIDLGDPSKLVTAADQLIKTRSESKLVERIPFGEGGIRLELTELLNQHARYIRHNQQLRRINEGDDTSDSAGYALHLVRIPVSLLPGRKTDVGYGAEIMFTIRQELGDDLLPMTFRNLVTNDIIDQLAPGLTMALNSDDVRKEFSDQEELVKKEKKLQAELSKKKQDFEKQKETAKQLATEPFQYIVSPLTIARATNQFVASSRQVQALEQQITGTKQEQQEKSLAPRTAVAKKVNISLSSTTRMRRAGLPFPSSQIKENLGDDEITNLVKFAIRNQFNQPFMVHLPDVQAFLQEELFSAYRMLMLRTDLWSHLTPDLIDALRSRKTESIRSKRKEFLSAVGCESDNQTSAYLAWAILIDSALLNEDLNRDMNEVATLKGTGKVGTAPHQLYLPGPLLQPEAKAAFNHYIHTRWPVHVFALDPEVQEQNIHDTFSLRREMQLAASLAFVSGRMSTRSFTSFARRLEAEFQTIALNRTCVAFNHGANTFGWRFYPRFQTPDIESNTTVLFRDLLWGGPSKNARLRQHRLEPGPRECTALVIMPSFVPYATLDVSSNWFKLTNPQHKEFTMQDAMRVSRVVKALQNCSPAVTDDVCYRDGDKYRMLARAQQLSERLPLQTIPFQVPYVNTLGGFEMFNSGTSDLAPELYGWYGEPGISTERDTILFLMGDHFSVHQTKVMAGGLEISVLPQMFDAQGKPIAQPTDTPNLELLSRQVMKVRIPKNVQAMGGTDPKKQVVALHIATPYGVSTQLQIPVLEKKPATTQPSMVEGYKLDPAKLSTEVVLDSNDQGTLAIKTIDLIGKERPVVIFMDASGTAPKAIKIKLSFVKDSVILFNKTLDFNFKETAKGYMLEDAEWKTLAESLRVAINARGRFKIDALPWGNGLASEKLVLTPVDVNRASTDIKLDQTLTFEIKIKEIIKP